MKQDLKLLLIVAVVVAAAFWGYHQLTKEPSLDKGDALPKFSLLTLEGKPFTNGDLPSDKEKLIIYYNSECPSCEEEVDSISSTIEKYKHVNLYFISFETADKINAFAEKNNLLNRVNVTFLEDRTLKFNEDLHMQLIPFALYCSADNEILEKGNGSRESNRILERVTAR